jgi:polyribonucleotide nucleotidyltransferase
MGFIDAIFGGFGSFVIKGINTAHQLAKNYIARLVDEALRERGVENQPTSNPTSVNVHVYNVQNDIKNNDLEQTEIEKKRARDGSLNLSDREKLEELKKQGEDKFEQWQKAKTQEVITEQAKNPDSYETSFLNNEKVHLLQFQMGQVVRGNASKLS